MKTSFIYIILLFLGILLLLPAMLMENYEITRDYTHAVEYNLGWNQETGIHPEKSNEEKNEILDFEEEEYELEDWMMKPLSWENELTGSGKYFLNGTAPVLTREYQGLSLKTNVGL